MDYEDHKVPVRLKLAALWAALMFLYIYADFFGLFRPGQLGDMNRGIIHPFGPATPALMLGVSLMMALPSLMVFAPLVMPPAVTRWANVVLGLVYGAIIILTMIGAPLFYLFFGVIEVALSALIVRYAWTWPRTAQAAP
ncbi:MAG: DUF6326 family protein [Sphingomicrobium sp.]